MKQKTRITTTTGRSLVIGMIAMIAMVSFTMGGAQASQLSGSLKNGSGGASSPDKGRTVRPSNPESETQPAAPLGSKASPTPAPTPSESPRPAPAASSTPAQNNQNQNTPSGSGGGMPQMDPKSLSPSQGRSDSEGWDKGNYKAFRGMGNCSCDGLLALKDSAVKEAIEYFRNNETCITGKPAGQAPPFMAINDYRASTGCMYIIDHNGTCKKALDAAYGVGSGNGGSPTPGCGNGSRMTPSGFHVTGPHTGGDGRYDTSNSLEMVDLQGQNSRGRGILIHEGSCVGGACTWGCTGVSESAKDPSPSPGFETVKSLLQYGSLVYNYFGGKNCPGISSNVCHRPGTPGGAGSGSDGARGMDGRSSQRIN